MTTMKEPSVVGTYPYRWFFFSTPLWQFLAVMVPLTLMMLLLAVLSAMPLGIRLSSAAVACISLYALWRGYHYRVEATPQYVRYRGWRKDIVIPWHEVHLIDRYTPLDRNRGSQYVFVTRLDTPPVDRREIDENTIQLQDRPGLLETLRLCRQSAQGPN